MTVSEPQAVLENSSQRQQKADVWHADVTWQPNPPKATILQAQDLPAEGGDTVWASTAAAVSRVANNSLLTLLFDLIKTPEIQARFKWKPGSVAVWDNRQVNHYGVNDHGAGFRKFHRLTIRAAAVS